MERRSRILGIGGYLPPRVVTNHDLAKVMDTTHEWIVERTGIHQRHWVDPGEGGAEMAAKGGEVIEVEPVADTADTAGSIGTGQLRHAA